MMRRRIALLTSALAILCLTPSCRRAGLLEHPDWAPDVKRGLNDLVTIFGNQPERSYAVFDFDNTTSIFDITENEMYFQLLTMSFELAPDRLAEVLSTDLPLDQGDYAAYVSDIRKAYGHLYDEFGPFTYRGLDEETMGEVKADPMWEEFASKMCRFYTYIYHFASPTVAYNWTKYWCCGMTEAQEYELAGRSHAYCSSIETFSDSWVGDVESELGPQEYTYTLGFTVTEPLKELWKVLDANGIDVWVCSASGTVPVLRAIDMFGLRPYCKGVLSMTVRLDEEGRLTNAYDYDGRASLPSEDGGWHLDSLATGAQTCTQGKVTAILNAIAPKYGGRGPIACFMDSTGDFNFCTEFADTKLTVCFNRGDRRPADGGSLIGETAIYEREVLGYNLKKADAAGDILFLLQGRNENGMRTLRPSNATIRFGMTKENIFATPENHARYRMMCDSAMTVSRIMEKFSPMFTTDYSGYRSIQNTNEQ